MADMSCITVGNVVLKMQSPKERATTVRDRFPILPSF